VIKGHKKEVKAAFGQWADAPKPNAKACLISGPPGIGKSTSARVIARELGFEILEMNASDTRNKKSIEELVKILSTNQSLDYFRSKVTVSTNSSKKSVIIMDEIDGMGGSDRGGIAAVIQVIKDTKTPIICICNDRYNQKLRSLTNYCFDVKFMKPQENIVIQKVQQIAKAENLAIDNEGLSQIVTASGNDIRQTLNTL
jgi:replication factor C subunit 1